MISVIKVNESKKWDSIVRSFKKYDVYYLSQYSKSFELVGEGEPLLIYYKDDTTRAINVIIKRDIGKINQFREKIQQNSWFDISTPYGYGGFIIEGSNYKALEYDYVEFCKKEGFISEFVRFNLFSEYHNIFNGEIQSYTNNVVRTLNLDIKEMLMDFEHKVRKNLKRANINGLEIEIDEKGKRIKEFLDIYYATMKRNNANSIFYFPESFFESLNKMHHNYIYMHVLYEKEIISTELLLYGKENSYSFLGGTKSEYFNLRPNDFLKYEIIKWSKEKGLKRFILGGGYGVDDGIFKYKKSFAPNGIHKFYIGKRIFDSDRYNKLVDIRNNEFDFDKDTMYFPRYRG